MASGCHPRYVYNGALNCKNNTRYGFCIPKTLNRHSGHHSMTIKKKRFLLHLWWPSWVYANCRSFEKLPVQQPKIISEYDQEIPQSQTADNPVAPRGRAAQPSQDTRKTN